MIELVIYAAILASLTLFIINAIINFSGIFARARAMRQLNSLGNVALERILRDIRLASSVDTGAGESVFDIHPGTLSLNTVLEPESATLVDEYITYDNGQLMLRFGTDLDDNVPITPAGVTIDRLIFHHIVAEPTPGDKRSEGIFVEIEAHAGRGISEVSTKLNGAAVLRGSYTSQ